METFNIIVAFSQNRGIGFNGKLPWTKIESDMKRFIQLTTITKDNSKKNCVIMGRKTWESILKPLNNRLNIIISSTIYINNDNTRTFKTLDDALKYCYMLQRYNEIESIFVIGGEVCYKEAIIRLDCKFIYTTLVKQDTISDTYFPNIPQHFKELIEHTTFDETCEYRTYKNIYNTNSEEFQYLNCLKKILETGEDIIDRTGIGTLSVFDENFKFTIDTINPDAEQSDLIYRVPALTTKKLYLNGVIWELLWFINGEVNTKWLKEKNVNIWNAHSSKEYLSSIGLDYEEGYIGPGYGHQWVNWGGDWKNKTGGINQIVKILEDLKKNPSSRRAVLSAWNVADLSKMALPPCHMMYIFKVTDHDKLRKKLNCKMIIRSNDMFLGSPFNILSTALLTILMSRALNMLPGSIAISITDAHIYKNHIEQVKKQLNRTPYEFPKLQITKDINNWTDMCNLSADNFKFIDYNHWDNIKGQIAV